MSTPEQPERPVNLRYRLRPHLPDRRLPGAHNGPRHDGNYGMPDSGRQGDGDDLRPPRPERDLPRLGQGHLDRHSFSMNGNRSDRSMPAEFQGSSSAWLCKIRCSVGTRESKWRMRAMARNFDNLRPDGRSKGTPHWPIFPPELSILTVPTAALRGISLPSD